MGRRSSYKLVIRRRLEIRKRKSKKQEDEYEKAEEEK